MDWKRLVQFALQGSGDLEQYAILLVRVSIGLFFAISGANKLFVSGGTKLVYQRLVQAKIPFPRQTAYFVSGWSLFAIPGDRRVCFEPSQPGFIDRYGCRHRDHRGKNSA